MKKRIGDLLNDIADAAAHAAAANARYCIRVDGCKVPLVSDETLPCSHIFLERCIKEMRRISIQRPRRIRRADSTSEACETFRGASEETEPPRRIRRQSHGSIV